MDFVLTKFWSIVSVLLTTVSYELTAKDLGTFGHLYLIVEEDLLETLKKNMSKLSKEQLDAIQKKVQKHYASYIQSPQCISGLKEAQAYRQYYFDPSLCADQDIRDRQGSIIVQRGKCINPLLTIFRLDDLLFFDGSDSKQVEWAKKQSPEAKWILTKGKPLELEENEGRPVYFDQRGLLIHKFGIHNIPARVSKEGLGLKIEEIPLGD